MDFQCICLEPPHVSTSWQHCAQSPLLYLLMLAYAQIDPIILIKLAYLQSFFNEAATAINSAV